MKNIIVSLGIVAMVSTALPFSAFSAEEDDQVIQLEKDVTAKRNELKGLRLRNPAYIWGDEKQSVATRKRMAKAGEKKYYASQVVDVRPWCVCKHAPLKNGGTKAKHSKSASPASYDQSSRGYECTPSEVCPQWKEWNNASIKVGETEQMNKEIDLVVEELEKLEAEYKEKLEANAAARKERKQQAAKDAEAKADAATKKSGTKKGKSKKK